MRTTTITSLFATLSLVTAQQLNIDAALDEPVPNLYIDPLAAPPAITYDAASAASSNFNGFFSTSRNDSCGCSPVSSSRHVHGKTAVSNFPVH